MPSIFQRDDGGMKAVGTDEYYYVGIIDILMLYTIRKQMEHAYKSLRYNKDEISSVNPKQYADRFQSFVSEIIE